MKRVTYHYCTMSQVQSGLAYNDGFLTVDKFDTSVEGSYSKIRDIIAEQTKQQIDSMVITSLTIVGEQP